MQLQSTLTTTGPPAGRGVRAEFALTFQLSAAAFLLLIVSPVAAFALSGFLLVNLQRSTAREVRWLLGLTMALAIALITGARPIEPGASNDIETYYEVYEGLAAGDLSELLRFGAGVELALPLLMLVLAVILPPLTPNGLMFCFALISALLILVWIELTFYRQGAARRPALIGIFFVMLNLYYSTQLTRQFMALIVLLFACTAGGRRSRWLFVLLATLFHVSSLAFFGLYLLARRGWVGWTAILLIATMLRLYFGQLLAALGLLPEAAAEKLNYYLDNLDEFTSSDINSLRTLLLLCLISTVALLASRFRPDADSRPWLTTPWMTAAVHTLLLQIPLASMRTTLAVHALVPGLMVYGMFSGRARHFAVPVFNVLLVYKVAALALAEQAVNLRSSAAMLQTFF